MNDTEKYLFFSAILCDLCVEKNLYGIIEMQEN